ncbi:DNA topoisomerase [Prevotella denticola CRIS 18C-A]|uniref:DNA topoisomerase n=1 Tax=Prevotella denticola CRIS 18C-A TaxID=944557 RepID=F0H4S5_9BACT|nr:type IA DNA topoisomerase [Prevotella denticola]EGC87204.1 DNA topoisomerase [Prevotella denticola CRIS 18C-A]
MKTIIAEKPSVAREIARVVDARKREEGYFTGNGYAVTWAFGHLVQLALPEAYGIKGFNRDALPIIPDAFKLVARAEKTEKVSRPDSGVLKQIDIIRRLFEESERIIVATDAGREGELIFRYLYQYIDCHTPFNRLWISSLTDKAIREGLNNLRNGGDYDNLYLSARARSEADWLVGINGTQALSLAAGRGTYSVGRVQTPTLAMVCARYWENRRFTPEAFWQLHLAVKGEGEEVVKFTSEEKWKEGDTANSLYKRIKETCKEIRIVQVERKQKTEEPPLLYDLTTLQKEANSRYGLTAEQTLAIAQKLYEAKLITYPRTSSRYIPDDVFETIPKLLEKLQRDEQLGSHVSRLGTLARRSVDGGKVTDHHALLTTGLHPIGIYKDELTVYRMIAARMVEAFSAPCIKEVTTVRTDVLTCDGEKCCDTAFTVKGSVIRQSGWRGVCGDTDGDTILPDWKEGDVLSLSACSITEGKTKPKPLHTEATLLAAMETAGKEIEDDTLRQAIKDCGIGTPATRAAIIETLLKREYMVRVKKTLVPTEKGLALYSIVKDMDIANVEMTGRWEAELARIERGEKAAADFNAEIEAYTRRITADLLASEKLFRARETTFACPKCGKGSMRFYAKVVKCDNEACALPLFRQVAGKLLSDKEITDLLTEGRTAVLHGFKSKQGKSFDAALAFDEEFRVKFIFDDTKNKSKGRKNGK